MNTGDSSDNQATRRAKLRDLRRCINGPLEDRPGLRGGVVHGPVISAGKCQRCVDVHKKTRGRSSG